MRSLAEKSGGYVVMSESFEGNIFKQSFKAVFARDARGEYLRMCFGGTLEVLTSSEFKVCGAIGNVNSLAKKSASVGETEIGQGNTCAWSMGALDEANILPNLPKLPEKLDERHNGAGGRYRLLVLPVRRGEARQRGGGADLRIVRAAAL